MGDNPAENPIENVLGLLPLSASMGSKKGDPKSDPKTVLSKEGSGSTKIVAKTTGDGKRTQDSIQPEEEIVISDSEEDEPCKNNDAIIISDSDPELDQGGLTGVSSICSSPKMMEEEEIQVVSKLDVETSSANSPSSSAEVKNLQNDTKASDERQIKEEEVVEVGRSESRKRKLDVEPSLSSLKHHYYYFCLNCEAENPGSKFPVTFDIVAHILEKGHADFQPISDVIQDRGHVFLENITYSPNFNKKVRTFLFVTCHHVHGHFHPDKT